jgi:hypothetical protein
VGKSGNLRERIRQYFGGSTPNYQGSQFVKFLYQIRQDEELVTRILASSDTLIAHVVIEEGFRGRRPRREPRDAGFPAPFQHQGSVSRAE